MLVPPNGRRRTHRTTTTSNSKVYFDRRSRGRSSRRKGRGLFGDADVVKITPRITALSNDAMLVVVVGQSFDGTLAPVPVDQTPTRQEAAVRNDPSVSLSLVQGRSGRSGSRSSCRLCSIAPRIRARSVPIRAYKVAGHRAVRLVFDTGANEYWGIQMTSWDDAPALQEPNEVVKLEGRRYELHYDGPHLHMVVLRNRGATYWVVNTVLNRLSNETMLAIAKGLAPLSQIQS